MTPQTFGNHSEYAKEVLEENHTKQSLLDKILEENVPTKKPKVTFKKKVITQFHYCGSCLREKENGGCLPAVKTVEVDVVVDVVAEIDI